MTVVYNTSLKYENVNKSIPRLFVCVAVPVQSPSRVCKLKTKYKLYALRIHQCKSGRQNVNLKQCLFYFYDACCNYRWKLSVHQKSGFSSDRISKRSGLWQKAI